MFAHAHVSFFVHLSYQTISGRMKSGDGPYMKHLSFICQVCKGSYVILEKG